MTLDFNTLEPQKAEKSPELSELEKMLPEGGLHHGRGGKTHVSSVRAAFLICLCVVMSLASVVLSLISIRNTPKPEPVIIQCDPNLLQKIENQARVLDEISKSAKSQPSSKVDKN